MIGWDALLALLAEAKAHDINAGEVVLEDDGDIGIDWGTESDCVISAHVNATGRIGFAALIHGWKAHGSSEAHIPDGLVEAFRRFEKAQR